MNEYKVYVRTNAVGVITDINSSEFLTDTTDWTQIDEGEGDKYHHAQGHYLPLGLTDENGLYNYKLVDCEVVERTASDKIPEIFDIENAKQMASIKERLSEIDKLEIRPLASIIAGFSTNADTEMLTQLEREKATLRAQFAELN